MRANSPTALAIGAVCAALAIAGCGGGDDPAAGSATDKALAYLPADAPFVASIGTDLEGSQVKGIEAILDRFPFGDEVKQQLQALVEEQSPQVDQIRKLLGNDFVVGSTNAEAFINQPGDSDQSFVGAIAAKDANALADLVKSEGAKEAGEAGGATIYEDDEGGVFAIEDDMLVVAGNREELEAAIGRADGDDALSEETFTGSLEGLAEDALIKTTFDVEALIAADPEAGQARKVKWVGALRTLGLTVAFESDRVAVDFRLASDGDLSEDDLPFASGGESPAVIERDGEIGFGLRDPSQVIEFAQSAAKSIDPQGFAEFEKQKTDAEGELDVDVDEDLFAQLTGDLSGSVALDGSFSARAGVEDPGAFEETFKKLRPGFESAGASSDPPIAFSFSDDALTATNDTSGPASLGDGTAVEGAEGAAVISADAEQLAGAVLGQVEGLGLGGQLGGALVTGPLGKLTGSVAVETDALTGSFELTFD